MAEKEVQALIGNLGFLENNIYYPEPDCFQNLRDLIRHMLRDDRLFTIRRLCNERNIVKNDLVPIMKFDKTSDELFDAALRLTVNLCQPTSMVFGNRQPDDLAEWQIFYQLETSLIRCLVAFIDVKIFKVFAEKMHEYFDKEWEDRAEKQRIVVERIFLLIRCIFAIGIEGIRHQSIPEISHSTRERVIANFFTSGISDIFLHLSTNSLEREFSGYMVAILALIFKTLNPETIAHEGDLDFKNNNKEQLEKEQEKFVECIKNKEINKRRINQRTFLSGTFVVKGMKALNPEKDFIFKGTKLDKENSSPIEALSKRKRQRLPPRNRRVDNLEVTEESSMETLQDLNSDAMLAIKQFCSRFLLEGRYNKLMRSIHDMAFGNHRQSVKITEHHFLMLATFMIFFARHSHFSSQHIHATFSTEFFHRITSYLTDCFEKMKIDRQHVRRFALCAQHAVTTFREMMTMLNFISNSIFAEEKEFFQLFCHQIFHVEEYRELAVDILSHLSPSGTTHKMLQDLIIANHYFLHLMEKSVKQGELRMVQKKKRQQKRKKAEQQKQKIQAKSIEENLKHMGLATLWSEIVEDLSDVLIGELTPNEDASPLNMLIKADDDQLQQFALLQIQRALCARKVADAVGIYRNARILWPETGTFGDDEIRVEDELLALNEIYHSEMQEVAKCYEIALQQAYGKGIAPNDQTHEAADYVNDEEEDGIDKDGGDADLDGSDDDGTNCERIESAFDFNGFISSMAKPTVLNWYIFAFKQFRTNPKEVNLAILKFLHRIAFDLKSPARLYQATLFQVFREINKEVTQGSCNDGIGTSSHQNAAADNRSQHPHFKLYEFGYFLLKKFFVHYEERGHGIIACELLFSKTPREAYEIEHGYGSMN